MKFDDALKEIGSGFGGYMRLLTADEERCDVSVDDDKTLEEWAYLLRMILKHIMEASNEAKTRGNK